MAAPLYDDAPNCYCGVKAELRIVGPQKTTHGRLYFACYKKTQRDVVFLGEVGVYERDEESVEDGSHATLETKVIFDPYKERRAVVPEIALYTGPMRCMGIVEPYLPDRVLRQFGFVQLVPGPPIGPKRGSKRGSVSTEYIVVYTWTDALWENWKYHVVPDDKRVVLKQGVPWESAPNYLDWFRTVSHVRVAPHRGVGQQGGGLAQRHEAALDLVQRALACATTSSNDHHRTLVQLEKILRGDMENDAQG